MPYYYLYALLRGLSLGLCLPIHELFLCQNGCSMFHIGLLGTVMESCKLICELPTAKITAKYGAKHSMLWAGILAMLCWMGYLLGTKQLALFYVCALLMGASEAFLTGSVEVWIIEQVLSTQTTQALLTNSRIIIISCVLSSCGSGWLYKQSMTCYLTCIIFVYMLSVLVPFMSQYSPTMRCASTQSPLDKKVSVLTSIRYISTQSKFMRTLAVIFFVTMASDMVMRYYQPLLWENAIDSTYSGVIFSTAAMIAWCAIGLINRYKNRILQHPLLLLGSLDVLGAVICVLIIATTRHYTLIALLMALLSIEDIRSPLIKILVSYYNASVTCTAMILSIFAMTESAAEVLAGVLLGFVVEEKGLYAGFLVSAMLFACAACISLFTVRHANKL